MEKQLKKQRFKERQFDLFGLSFHLYPCGHRSCAFQVMDLVRIPLEKDGVMVVAKMFLVVNIGGIGFAISNFESEWLKNV